MKLIVCCLLLALYPIYIQSMDTERSPQFSTQPESLDKCYFLWVANNTKKTIRTIFTLEGHQELYENTKTDPLQLPYEEKKIRYIDPARQINLTIPINARHTNQTIAYTILN